MTIYKTESSHAQAAEFDLRPPQEALLILASAQAEAAAVVQAAIPQIAQAAQIAADTITRGGRLIYAAAGSSGLMALADALELPGTYGIERNRVKILFAGGVAALSEMVGGPEDDGEAARDAVMALHPGPEDCLIALTASGSTPYPVTALETAKAAGARTIGMANNPDVPVLRLAEVPILLPTPAEVVAGSTRMGAGTAQKIALNMISTMMAVHLGHVYDGYMVNVVADNLKLRVRARGIVVAITSVADTVAAEALEHAGGAVKPAILIAAGAQSMDGAQALLLRHGGHLRPALQELGGPKG